MRMATGLLLFMTGCVVTVPDPQTTSGKFGWMHPTRHWRWAVQPHASCVWRGKTAGPPTRSKFICGATTVHRGEDLENGGDGNGLRVVGSRVRAAPHKLWRLPVPN